MLFKDVVLERISNTLLKFLKFYLQIGEYIASNGGVVTAEELAPYLDIDRTMV